MIKTASFAIVHFSVAFAVAFALTGSVVIGGLVLNTVAYHFHEKVWERIRARRAARASAAPRGPAIAA